MALRLGFKISRLQNIFKPELIAVTNPNSKTINLLKSAQLVRSYSQKQFTHKPKNNDDDEAESATDSPDILNPKVSKCDDVKRHINVISTENDCPVQIRRKFAKSSTQIAITQPLKLPRLANPFPDPVKSLPSDTVSDDEKARLEHEQVKIETRYNLHMQQEMLLQQKLDKMSEEQNITLSSNKVRQESSTQSDYTSHANLPVYETKQPKFRKPKHYLELQKEEDLLQSNKSPDVCDLGNKCEEETSENSCPPKYKKNDVKDKHNSIKYRKKGYTRAAKYLRHSWYPRHIRKQIREYSSKSYSPLLHPEIISVSKQCDMLIKQLRRLHPQYENFKKPIFIPGSQEEKEFLKSTLKLIAKHKSETARKLTAPFPSYSEIKTYVSEPIIKDSNINNNYDYTNDDPKQINFRTVYSSRYYSTKNVDDKMKKKNKHYNPNTRCLKNLQIAKRSGFKMKDSDMIRPPGPKLYPSYSDLCDEGFENESSECDICPSKLNLRELYNNKINESKSDHNHYSIAATNNPENIKLQKKPPCKNPYPIIPTCDYEKTAEKRKKKHRTKEKKDKKTSHFDDSNKKIISKIKCWLNLYKPNTDNIKISKSPVDVDGRETYIIEVCNYEDQDIPTSQNLNLETIAATSNNKSLFENVNYQPIEAISSHVVEMTDSEPVLVTNIPHFTSAFDANVFSYKPEEFNFRSIETIKYPSDDVKINLPDNGTAERENDNLNDCKNFQNVDLPEPCPIVSRSIPGMIYLHEKKIPGRCPKVKKPVPDNKKCRTPKKKKLPSCEDLANIKKSSPHSIPIPCLETKSEFKINPSKRTYFKKLKIISNYVNAEPVELGTETNKPLSSPKDVVPFKLKPQFWKK